jgi:hypothetical protein
VLKRTIVAGALALFSIGPAGAQSLARSQSPAVSTVPANFAAVQACEAQMRRLAGSNNIRRSRPTTTPSVSTTTV